MVDNKNIAIGVGVAAGTILGLIALPLTLGVIGLTIAGPVAGGIFAVA